METQEQYLITAGGRIKCLRCTAMSKNSRLQCAKPALKVSKTQKCGHHGGKGSGPKTAEGKARIGAVHLVHGKETNERRQDRSKASLRLAQLEAMAHAIGLITAARTVGRKPSGYRPIKTVEEATAWAVEDALHRVRAVRDEE